MSKVAVIGECMIELYENKQGLYKQTFGGDTFNCAVYLKRMLKSSKVEYITVLGYDELSNKMLDFFKQNEINSTYVDKIKNKNPGLYIINIKNNDRTFSYWRGQAAAKELFLTKSLNKIINALLSYDLIYFSSITLAIMSKEGRKNFFNMLDKAKKNGVKIAFDTNYRPSLYKNKEMAKQLYNEAIKYCHIFLPSIDDEKDLWGDINPKEIINKAKKAHIKEVVIKCGKNDIIYHFDGKTSSIKTNEITNIVDTTSAGDSFNGAYLASRIQLKGVEESIEIAKGLSSKVIMHQGAIIPKDING